MDPPGRRPTSRSGARRASHDDPPRKHGCRDTPPTRPRHSSSSRAQRGVQRRIHTEWRAPSHELRRPRTSAHRWMDVHAVLASTLRGIGHATRVRRPTIDVRLLQRGRGADCAAPSTRSQNPRPQIDPLVHRACGRSSSESRRSVAFIPSTASPGEPRRGAPMAMAQRPLSGDLVASVTPGPLRCADRSSGGPPLGRALWTDRRLPARPPRAAQPATTHRRATRLSTDVCTLNLAKGTTGKRFRVL